MKISKWNLIAGGLALIGAGASFVTSLINDEQTEKASQVSEKLDGLLALADKRIETLKEQTTTD